MCWKGWVAISLLGINVGWILPAHAADFKITLPKHSRMTPVQELNRAGVDAVRKRSYQKAEALFYKAYLLDPDDPFTLNNLGYISELQGQVDRAQRFYELAGQQASDAVIARASSRRVEGRSMKEALAVPDEPLQLNHDNVEAVRLLSQGRAPEADLFLKRVLEKDENDIFTLNNMGVAKEMEGESQAALKFYDEAAALHSDASAVVTLDHSWRGKPVSEMAAQNARKLRTRLEAEEKNPGVRVAELNISGVSAINRNDLSGAEQAFRKAYAADPNNAFAVNNIGYVAEIEGDRETAQFFYDRAQTVAGKATVGLATRRSAEGSKLLQVAEQSDAKVEAKVKQERDIRRAQHEPILLRRRHHSAVEDPATPAASGSVPQQQNPPSH